KLTVSPLTASASAWRSEPGPLSLLFVTVIVAPQRLGTPTAVAPSNKIRKRPVCIAERSIGRKISMYFIDVFVCVLVFRFTHCAALFWVSHKCFYRGKAETVVKTRQVFSPHIALV